MTAQAVATVNAILKAAIADGASEVHLSEGGAGGSMVFIVDGLASKREPLWKGDDLSAVAGRLKELAKIGASGNHGSFTIKVRDRNFQIDVWTAEPSSGQSLVLSFFESAPAGASP